MATQSIKERRRQRRFQESFDRAYDMSHSRAQELKALIYESELTDPARREGYLWGQWYAGHEHLEKEITAANKHHSADLDVFAQSLKPAGDNKDKEQETVEALASLREANKEREQRDLEP